jgi:hypothetical protein
MPLVLPTGGHGSPRERPVSPSRLVSDSPLTFQPDSEPLQSDLRYDLGSVDYLDI